MPHGTAFVIYRLHSEYSNVTVGLEHFSSLINMCSLHKTNEISYRSNIIDSVGVTHLLSLFGSFTALADLNLGYV